MSENNQHLVSCEWLETHLKDPNVRVVDMRGYVVTRQIAPGVEEATYMGAPDEYLQGHIPGAVYLDWTKDIIDPNDSVPVQIAKPESFADVMSSSGIGPDTHVVIADHAGGQFATRLWWALKYYGHDKTSVLDGGYIKWNEEDLPLEEGKVIQPRAEFKPHVRLEWRKNEQEVKNLIGNPDVQILDIRDSGQYSGAKRRGARGGHIPGAISIPRELFLAQGGGFKSPNELRKLVTEKQLNPIKCTVAYCNGGVAATVALFNLDRLGFTNLSNYDGSWNEWAEHPELPVETD